MSTIESMLATLKRFFAAPGQQTPGARLFWVGLLVRVAYITLAHTYRVRAGDDHFEFGWEMGRIARSLITGHGYADPFHGHTGPTAWVPPIYPLLLAGVFKLFGVYTPASGWVLFAVNSVFSAATAPLLFQLAVRVFVALPVGRARSIALWSGWLWALHPAAMQYAVRWPWETSLTTFLFTWSLVLTLTMRAEPGRKVLSRWLGFGLLWGLIALSNSTLLLFLPCAGFWILLAAPTRRGLVAATLAGVVFVAVLAPWAYRNQRAFHAFVPLRGNFGAELYLANGPNANGLLMEYNHPNQSAAQFRLYASMGEVAYSRMRGRAAEATIAADPGLYVRNTLKRVYFYWVSVPHPQDKHAAAEFFRVLDFAFISLAGLMGLGLAVSRRIPAAVLLSCAVLLLPVPYYLVTVHARFRHPLEPLLCLFGVYLFQSTAPRLGKDNGSTNPEILA